MWQADHSLFPIWVKDGQGKSGRPWLTVIEDDKSRALAGYWLSWSAPSAMQTALTRRPAIWRKEDPRWQVCGIPEVFYTDHGTDFTSVHLSQVGADLKMQLVYTLGRSPAWPREGRAIFSECGAAVVGTTTRVCALRSVAEVWRAGNWEGESRSADA